MKIPILLISLLIFATFAANAQNAGDYIKDDEIDKFVGTWEWKSGNDYFRIIISKQKLEGPNFSTGDRFHMDMAICWHIYVKNGITIDSSMDKANKTYTDAIEAIENCSLSGSAHSQYLSILYRDKQKDKFGNAKLTMLPGKSDEAKWELREWSVAILEPNKPLPIMGYTIPTDVIMKKIN